MNKSCKMNPPAISPDMPAITCDNVSLSYEGKNVLSGVHFSLPAGSYLCIVGENGSGKSTFIRALLGLKAVAGGSICLSSQISRCDIGYMPQTSAIQRDFPASVEEVILSGCMRGRNGRPVLFVKKEQRELAKKAMEKLGITSLIRKSYRELSGGQQQRVLLARALCSARQLLVLDEPAAGLDPLITADMYRIVKEVNEAGITVVMVSHDIGCIIHYASHILHLQHTQLFFGSASEYAASEAGRSFLGGHDHA